ncbi:hypothetical protein HQQ81_16150 [Microbacteriaceae bacterium VKM Ac-2854]|nr:hypothetical protein [Microbacteriaceae bacterium VKM Ac-2854]
MTRTGVDRTGVDDAVPARPPRRGFWNYAPAARWTQLAVPLLAVSGLLFDIVSVLESAPADASPTLRIQQIAIAVLYTFGLILLPFAVTWAAAVVVVTAFLSVPWASPEVPASTLVFATGFVVALTPPTFIVGYLLACLGWGMVVAVSSPGSTGLMVTVSVGVAAAAGIGYAVRRVLVERAVTAARTQMLRRDLADAAAQQRRLIAHDLHDVVAHHITLIRMVSNMGIRGGGEAEPRELMATISASAASALAELRRLLQVLDPDESAGGEAGEVAVPRGAAERVERVVAELRAAGIDVEVEVAQDADRRVPEAVRVTLDRILIEATTNVLKHAGDRADCRIHLRRTADSVTLEVSNRLVAVPHRPASAPGGYGVAGMRRRAAEVGGRVDAAAVGDRWVVRATLPAGAL